MKIHYVTIDGKVRISNANINQRLIEMPDGNHTYPNDGVWQDSERRKDSMIMILQGVRGPYGSNTTGTDIPSVLYEMELAEITDGSPMVLPGSRQMGYISALSPSYLVQ